MNQTSSIKNLWGDLPIEDTVRTPSIILKEQATLLTEATNGLLLGNISKRSLSIEYVDGFECSLEIKVPSINNYSISIVKIQYPITIYPLTIISQVTNDRPEECQTEEDLNRVLGKILSSKEVKRIISGLLSEVRADTVKEQ